MTDNPMTRRAFFASLLGAAVTAGVASKIPGLQRVVDGQTTIRFRSGGDWWEIPDPPDFLRLKVVATGRFVKIDPQPVIRYLPAPS